MARNKLDVVPGKVRRVKEQFERWRTGKQSRERIPPKLWRAATNLCGIYSVYRVSRWLRLNYTALQERGRAKAHRSGPKPDFVEWGLPAGIASSTEYVVEAVGGGAQRIHVRGAGPAEVAALVRALRTDSVGN